MTYTPELTERQLNRLVEAALKEDLGKGDPTSAILPERPPRRAVMLAKQAGVVSGIHVARAVFKHLDPHCRVYVHFEDGEEFRPGDELLEVLASLPVLLTGERTALNFIQQLSGVATLTAQYVKAMGLKASEADRVTVRDTRKTVPGLRVLQKAAVVHGGGHNHRMRLDDMVMLKNNHVDALGSITKAVEALKASGWGSGKHRLPICIEVRNQKEAKEAASQEPMPDIIMLDNMSPDQVLKAATMIGELAKKRGVDRPQLEVSGGITLETIGAYAKLPIDRISVGALTHSAPAVDIAFRISAG
jgi:nicotinate-nucleotide pyrophosphorylase (carboxylating)